MANNTKRSFVVLIKGHEWTVTLQSHSAYKRMHDESEAITYPMEREMFFDKSKVSLSLIRHEIFHSLLASLDLEYTPMDAEAQEELDCTVYANNKNQLNEIEEKIVNFVLKGGVI
jgi:hypothetical protein